MEVKVWMEGIQRVVCGVDEHTTCHDLILAMAQATGRTGRFSMIEKCRGKERRLSPTDNPVRILQKWGEYATDIQFILRHSSGSKRSVEPLLVRRSDTHRAPPFHQGESAKITGKLQKSRTFSGAHACDFFSEENSKVCGIESGSVCSGRKDVRPVHINHSVESSEQSSVTSRSSASISPYPSLERRLPCRTVNGFAGPRVGDPSIVHKGDNSRNLRPLLTCIDNCKSGNEIAPIGLIKSNKFISTDVSKESGNDKKSILIGSKDQPLNQGTKSKLPFATSTRAFDSKSDKLMDVLPKLAHNDISVEDDADRAVKPVSIPNEDRSREIFINHVPYDSVDSVYKKTSPGELISRVLPITSTVSPSTVFRSSSNVTSKSSSHSTALVEAVPTESSVKSLSNRFLVNSFSPSDEQRVSDSGHSFENGSANKHTADNILDSSQSTRFADARTTFVNRESEESLAVLDGNKLIEMCKKQKEELEEREKEMTLILSEVAAAEEATQSSEVQRRTALTRLEELEQEERMIDAELMDLELVSWEDKRNMELQKLSRMTTELTLLRTSVARSDKDIVRIEENNRQLSAELDAAILQRVTTDRDVLLKDDDDLMTLDDMRKRLNEAQSRSGQSEEVLTKATHKVLSSQQGLAEKQITLDHLQQALKEVNLNSFRMDSVNSGGKLDA